MTVRSPFALSALSLLLPGCVMVSREVVVVEGTDPSPAVVGDEPGASSDSAPWVEGGEAFVWYDPALQADLVRFGATVGDPDGLGDVLGVWADVYDDWDGGALVGSVELVPGAGPSEWVAEVYASDLWLDPMWGGYSVDLVVYDWSEGFGWLTLPLETYAR